MLKLRRLLPLALLAGLSLLALKAQAPAPAPLDGGDPIPTCNPPTCPPGR